MEKIHFINPEFISICNQILNKNLSIAQWNLLESSDEFQTKNYCGGFDATENEFTFSFFNKKQEEFWFQLALSDIKEIIDGTIKKVILCSAG